MAGLLRRSLRWKPQLAEKTRNRDQNACDPRGQAGKQHNIGQEKRHATASPFPPLCSPILTVQEIPLRRISDSIRKSFRARCVVVPTLGRTKWAIAVCPFDVVACGILSPSRIRSPTAGGANNRVKD